MHTHIHTYVRTNIHTYTHTHIHTYTHTHIHSYIHTYRHTYKHTLHYITLHCITLHYITLHYCRGRLAPPKGCACAAGAGSGSRPAKSPRGGPGPGPRRGRHRIDPGQVPRGRCCSDLCGDVQVRVPMPRIGPLCGRSACMRFDAKEEGSQCTVGGRMTSRGRNMSMTCGFPSQHDARHVVRAVQVPCRRSASPQPFHVNVTWSALMAGYLEATAPPLPPLNPAPTLPSQVFATAIGFSQCSEGSVP